MLFCGKYRVFILSLNTNTHPLTVGELLAIGPMGVLSKTLQCLARSVVSPKTVHFNLFIVSYGVHIISRSFQKQVTFW